MILLLDTSTPICKLTLVDGGQSHRVEWEANRELAKGLLKFLQTEITKLDKTWQDIEAIGVFKGPGSFTGLRIGLTVLNTMADSLNIPIVGAVGENWSQHAVERLQGGENDQIVLPEYGSEAHVTKPRK